MMDTGEVLPASENEAGEIKPISIVKPTVGRMVYYKSYGTPNGEYKPENRAAIITAIHSDTVIDLCVLNPEGMFFNRNVEQGEKGGQWDWMPFQKDQQARLAK